MSKCLAPGKCPLDGRMGEWIDGWMDQIDKHIYRAFAMILCKSLGYAKKFTRSIPFNLQNNPDDNQW